MVQQVYVNKDIDAMVKIDFPTDLRIFSTLYYSRNDVNEYIKYLKNKFNFNYTSLPIDSYKVIFEGNGQLVYLLHNNPDYFYRGKLAAELEYIDEDGDLSSLFLG